MDQDQGIVGVDLVRGIANDEDIDSVTKLLSNCVGTTDELPNIPEESIHNPNNEKEQLPDGTCQSNSATSVDVILDSLDPIFDELNLLNLPTELILHICSFLDAKFVVTTLSLVCHHFHNIVNDHTFWKVRMRKHWPSLKYPIVPVDAHEFNWKDACMQRETQFALWTNPSFTMHQYSFSEGFLFAAVDTVHLMKGGRFLAAGSRDRYVNLIDLAKIQPDDPQSLKTCRVTSINNAHRGWIWSVNSYGNTMITASWDTYLKFWAYDESALTEYQNVKCKSALLCIFCEPNFVAAGSYDKKIYFVDPRSAQLIRTVKQHSRPVLCIAGDERYIISGSEDSTIAVFDRVAGKLLKCVQFDEYPLCMSYYMGQLWTGDKTGKVNVFDATDGDFSLCEQFSNVHQDKLTGVILTKGAAFTCSMDKTIKVWHPTVPLAPIHTITHHSMDVAKIAVQNEILASASSDVSIGVWIPKDHTFPNL